ncbi:H-2 class I histocompatibility antigen, K-B alpha chain-like [Megalobrama amblycephala]|uniref:H-2 class I histocompatibility antigen, K-B alpha chain-like n=1 Tax=Megalobrama amblycephala TaxID=75352 RepID=UPI0020142D76|nr:H-2 class I histocompatibility antigen, K-B alpha chain-like [Megalobrama amblycephala]
MKWIDKNPKAKETKEKWDHQTERNKFIKLFLKTCMHWISMFHITKTIPTNVRAFVPKVSAVESNLVLTCLATGFYSRDVQMYIRLNRNILEDQTSSGIRSNGDETFQMRISVKINGNHQGSYDCLFIQNSLTLSRQVLTLSDGRCFNCEMDPSWSVKAAITAVLAPVLTIVILCCIFSDRLKSVTTISYNPPNTIQPYQHSTPPKLKPNLPPWME